MDEPEESINSDDVPTLPEKIEGPFPAKIVGEVTATVSPVVEDETP